MKSQYILLTGLLLGTGFFVNSEEMKLSDNLQENPLLRAEAFRSNHEHKIINSNNEIQPPRLASPAEFDSIQASLASSLEKKEEPKKKRGSITGCTSASQLTGLSGSALVDAIKLGNLSSCLYGLYNTNYVGTALFSDANMLAVIAEINTMLATFDGTNATGAAEIEKLVTYLRALHWAENSVGSRTFDVNYKTALNQAFTSYFSGDHFVNFTGNSSRNFMLRYEMLILLNSTATNRQPFLPRFSQAILGYANTVARTNSWGVSYEENGMTQLLTHYFNAMSYEQVALEATLASHPEIIDNLKQFVESDGLWLVGHTREYQWSDAVSELGRFLKLGGQHAATVRPVIQDILATYSYVGAGSNGWINAQGMVTAYDSANCASYGDACSFNLESTILSGNHVCSDTLKVRYQEPISNQNLLGICQSLTAQETVFHQTFATNSSTPVPNDNNADLEIVIFSSSTDYRNFAGTFFGINTDNGGMYLEGEPSAQDNQARFIAYQATWLPDFTVWNLNHEYIHYLDGRFNKWGSFSDQDDNSVWWGEGLAEYLSQPNTNPNALAVAQQQDYQLSELFQTTYANSNTARTYYWGYLAVRFMFEQQRSLIDNELLPSLRAVKYQVSDAQCSFDWGWKAKPDAIANDWFWLYDDSEWSTGYWVWTCGQANGEIQPIPEFTPYQDVINNWGTQYDAAFSEWLTCLVNGNGVCNQETNPADFDQNGVIDKRDISLFTQLLRNPANLPLTYDFNGDGVVNFLDVRVLMGQCTLSRCAIPN